MCRTYVTRGQSSNWKLVSMPSVGLGGIARGGVRMDKRGVASRLYGGEYRVNLHFLAGFLFPGIRRLRHGAWRLDKNLDRLA